MSDLDERIKEKARELGAADVRLTTREIMSDGPPSADAAYVMPKAESVISFMVPRDADAIPKFLAKEEYKPYCDAMYDEYQLLGAIGEGVVALLESEGFKAISPSPNDIYRPELDIMSGRGYPDFSHRYAAYASGIGVPGWSGNCMTEEYGAWVMLGSVVTDAKLTPDEPLDTSYCDNCRNCVKSCPTDMFDMKASTSFILGGKEYTYAKRHSYVRCALGCGGFTGLSKNKQWSTWSTGRYDVPSDDAELPEVFAQIFKEHEALRMSGRKGPGFSDSSYKLEAGARGVLARPRETTAPTCANCQNICAPTREQRDELWKILQSSGVVIVDENGELQVVSPDEAERSCLPKSLQDLD